MFCSESGVMAMLCRCHTNVMQWLCQCDGFDLCTGSGNYGEKYGNHLYRPQSHIKAVPMTKKQPQRRTAQCNLLETQGR